MLKNSDFVTARDILLEVVHPVAAETVHISDCAGKILAASLRAIENVPPFDRSPYDGYAFRSADSEGASLKSPVTLCILEEVPAGAVPTKPCAEGTAIKILTGAPIPKGADAVIQYEKTTFTQKAVTIYASAEPGENIVRAGEDIRKGDTLAKKGERIGPGIAGTLAAQGIAYPMVYRIPRVGIISTGNEVTEIGKPLAPGKIYDSNYYMLSAALREIGCEPVYLGRTGDSSAEICGLLQKGLDECDAIVSTGGVSVGDYDLMPEAMEKAEIRMLLRGVAMKPGMACAYGEKDGKIICGLSGNPASALTNFYAIAAPALKKLTGQLDYIPTEFQVILKADFKKRSPCMRLLRGKLDISKGNIQLDLPKDQGNVVLSSAIGCDAFAIIPAGTGPVSAGTILRGWKI